MVLGCSDGGRLPAALHEARAVAAALGATGPVRPLIEDEATAAAVTEALPNCGVAHFATHAAFRHDNPLFSWVRLADGHLALADLGELSLRGQPLVVLSACESGRGRPRGGGIVGMARGFLLAGAATLVTSLWKIADDSSAQLMADFYRALASGTAPSALAEAQRQAIARGEHPFHWAAFVCIEA
jgi:CHAT domain-containing protein